MLRSLNAITTITANMAMTVNRMKFCFVSTFVMRSSRTHPSVVPFMHIVLAFPFYFMLSAPP